MRPIITFSGTQGWWLWDDTLQLCTLSIDNYILAAPWLKLKVCPCLDQVLSSILHPIHVTQSLSIHCQQVVISMYLSTFIYVCTDLMSKYCAVFLVDSNNEDVMWDHRLCVQTSSVCVAPGAWNNTDPVAIAFYISTIYTIYYLLRLLHTSVAARRQFRSVIRSMEWAEHL